MATRITRGAAIKQAALLASREENNALRPSSPHGSSVPGKVKLAVKKTNANEISPKEKMPKFETESHATVSLTTSESATESLFPAERKSRRKMEFIANKTSIADVAKKETAFTKNHEKKRKRPTTSDDADDYKDLPHNMGRVQRPSKLKSEKGDAEILGHLPKKRAVNKPAGKIGKTEGNDRESDTLDRAEVSSAKKDETAAKKEKIAKGAQDAKNRLAAWKVKLAKETANAAKYEAKHSSSKKTKKDQYGLTEGVTPFPNWSRPTAEECQEVHDLLWNFHKNEVNPQPKTIPPPSELVAGCGEVRSILDALIRTKLSASTTFDLANAAYRGMVARYGILGSGVGKGSCDYNAVRQASVEDLYYAIGGGGLGATKSAEIKAILDLVFEENQERRKESFIDKGRDGASVALEGLGIGESSSKTADIDLAEDENLSLDYCYTLSTDDAMRKFRSYPGIGVKTAACVALFCLQRPCFAVDTHVFRLCQWLDWVPPPDQKVKGQKTVNRDTMFSHLEVRVPDKLKYMLHQLFLAHGKTCPKCKAIEGKEFEGVGDGCVIEHLVERTRPEKGKSARGKKARLPTEKGKEKRKPKSDADVLDKNEGFSHPDEDEEDEYRPELKKTALPKQKKVARRSKGGPSGREVMS